jgi:hypothetical protein
MTAYELMLKTNHFLIKGGELADGQKQEIVGKLLMVLLALLVGTSL